VNGGGPRGAHHAHVIPEQVRQMMVIPVVVVALTEQNWVAQGDRQAPLTGPLPHVLATQRAVIAPLSVTTQICPEAHIIEIGLSEQVTVPQAPVSTLQAPLLHVAIVRPAAGQAS
jgi:hypothetical protein